MKTHIPISSLPGGAQADVLNGHEHGGVPVSLFLIHNQPGEGPELHRHPYAEIFILHEGSATFDLDGESLGAAAGDIVVAPPGAAHRFTNSGEGRLTMTCIHPAAEMESEWL